MLLNLLNLILPLVLHKGLQHELDLGDISLKVLYLLVLTEVRLLTLGCEDLPYVHLLEKQLCHHSL